MDPATIVGLIGTAVSLIGASARIAQSLHDLSDKYQGTNAVLTSIIQQCKTLTAAVTQIKAWIEDTLARTPSGKRQRMVPLSNALVDFLATLNPLEEEVNGMLGKAKPSGLLPRRVKLQSVWKETKMKDHLDNLRWQANAIQLLLASTQLSPEESTRRMEGIAQAASHFRDGSLFSDNGSTIDEVDFEFDTLLVNTATYRRAMRSHLRQSSSQSFPRPEVQQQLPIESKVADTVSAVEEDLIDLSSEHDIPLATSLPQEPPLTPTLALFRDMEASQRWEHRITSDGRIFYWNSLTKAETSPAFELAFPGEPGHPLASNTPSVKPKVADDPQTPPNKSQSSLEATANPIGITSSFTEVVTPLSSPSPEYGNWSKFQSAIYTGDLKDLEQVKLDFLDPRQDLNENFFTGSTSRHHYFEMKPLHFACLCQHSNPETRLSVIQWLLDCGASPNSRDSDEDTPMHYVAQSNDVAVAALLLRYGTDANAKGSKEYTPLHQATHYGALEMVLFLLQNGASTTSRNADGNTPLTTKFNARGYDYAPIEANTRLQIRYLLSSQSTLTT